MMAKRYFFKTDQAMNQRGVLAKKNDSAATGWPERKAGFTLLELLVVMAVVAVLAGLLLPVLSQARKRGQTLICQNNERQLILAWMLYIDEHEGWLPYNYGTADTKRTVAAGKFYNWVNNVMSWELDEDNTNTWWIAAGGLGPYLQGVTSPFHCPSDRVLSDVQKRAGWRERLRSVSMNAMLGYAGQFTRQGTNVNNPEYLQFYKQSEIPNPSQIFVFIEEHPDSIDDGYFLNQLDSMEWHDLPASYHNGGANLSFADGHLEYRQWRFGSTRPPARPDAASLPLPVPSLETGDYDWLMQRTSVSRYEEDPSSIR
jgi:prepilin-type N-terminal cleavage/methylation domain-containing protein/prepilin-type processing-associated H-X9-DG protein